MSLDSIKQRLDAIRYPELKDATLNNLSMFLAGIAFIFFIKVMFLPTLFNVSCYLGCALFSLICWNWKDKPFSPVKKTEADRIFDGVFAESVVFERLDDLFPDYISHLAYDHYDSSVEIYFIPNVPLDFSFSEGEAQLIFTLGFDVAYLNFADGTEQIISRQHGVLLRQKVANPKWNEESQQREYLLQRADRIRVERDDYAAAIEKDNNFLWGLLYPENPTGWEYRTQPHVHIKVALDELRKENADLRNRLENN